MQRFSFFFCALPETLTPQRLVKYDEPTGAYRGREVILAILGVIPKLSAWSAATSSAFIGCQLRISSVLSRTFSYNDAAG